MNLSIVIPNYNGEKLLKKNLPTVYDSVKNYKDGRVEIIFADDASVDNSGKVINEFIENISDRNIVGKTVFNKDKKQRGFSKNVNRGVELATGDILILLNTDVAPRKDFLDALIPHFRDAQVFAVGCMDESIEGDKKVLRGRGVGKWERGFLAHARGEVDKSNTLWVSGGSGAFNKKIWDKLGGLDELYNPFYWEDIDLSYRALKAGYKIFFERESVVVHSHESGTIKSEYKSGYVKKIAYRNQFIFVWKNITDLSYLFKHIYWLPYYFLKAVINRDRDFFGGFTEALGLFAQIYQARQKLKKQFKLSDEEVIGNLLE